MNYEPFLTLLVHTLLHTLWQGAIVAAALLVMLHFLPARAAKRRYAACGISLLLMLVGAGFTWAWLDAPASRQEAVRVTTLAATELVSSGPTQSFPFSTIAPVAEARARSWVTFAAVLWAAGFSLFLIRAVTAVQGARRLRASSQPLVAAAILELVEELRGAMHATRRLRVRLCSEIRGPAVMGVWSPVILLPASALTGMPPEMLRALLAHEMAHVRRYDYLVNLLQMLLEAVLFFNPFVWWVSQQMRREREACCDAMAVDYCGHAADYAGALLEWRTRWAAIFEAPGAAMAATGPWPSTLQQRIKRLLVPEYRVPYRLRWFSVLGVLGASGLAVALLLLASRAAVAVLSPEERIEKMVAIQEQQKLEDPVFSEKEVTVTGRIVLENGTLFPEEVNVSLHSRAGNSGSSTSMLTQKGEFSVQMSAGRIHVGVSHKGYAAAFAGPVMPGANGTVPPLELRLVRGFDAKIQVVDHTGRPISGAKCSFAYPGPPQVSFADAVSDDQGRVLVNHAASAPVEVEVFAAGYELTQHKIILHPNDVLPLTLTETDAATGVVTDAATGEPIEGAAIKLVGEYNRTSSRAYGVRGRVIAHSSASGSFRLDTLARSKKSTLMIEAAGHASNFLDGVAPGQTNLQVKLKPPIKVSGSIVNAPEGNKIWLSYFQRITAGHHTDSQGASKEVAIVDGKGSFELPGLMCAPLALQAGGKTINLPTLDSSHSDIVIDVKPNPPPVEAPKRTVEVEFVAPPGAPPPRGELKVQATTTDNQGNTRGNEQTVAINGSRAMFEVPIGCRLSLDDKRLIGYAFANLWSSEEVPVGAEPFILKIPLLPAGSIFGEVVDEDGRLAAGVMISANYVKSPPGHNISGGIAVKDTTTGANDRRSRFHTPPLRFGGTYAIVATQGVTWVMSEPLLVDEKSPIHEVRLVMPKGVSIGGQVLGPDGKPVGGLPLRLGLASPGGHLGSSGAGTTNSEGRFLVNGVNPAVKGTYIIEPDSGSDYIPTRAKVTPGRLDHVVKLQRGTVIEGTVIDDATGRPVSGVELYAMCTDPSQHGDPAQNPTANGGYFDADARTGRDGRFRFSTLPKLEVRVNVRGAKLVGTAEPVVPGTGKTVTLRVSVTPGRDGAVVGE